MQNQTLALEAETKSRQTLAVILDLKTYLTVVNLEQAHLNLANQEPTRNRRAIQTTIARGPRVAQTITIKAQALVDQTLHRVENQDNVQ